MAQRGCSPPGIEPPPISAAPARHASSPPDVTASTRHPRSMASWKQARVSAVEPEYDEQITRVSLPQNSGRVKSLTATTGIPNRPRYKAARTSPATPDPPIPQTTMLVAESAEGR